MEIKPSDASVTRPAISEKLSRPIGWGIFWTCVRGTFLLAFATLVKTPGITIEWGGWSGEFWSLMGFLFLLAFNVLGWVTPRVPTGSERSSTVWSGLKAMFLLSLNIFRGWRTYQNYETWETTGWMDKRMMEGGILATIVMPFIITFTIYEYRLLKGRDQKKEKNT